MALTGMSSGCVKSQAVKLKTSIMAVTWVPVELEGGSKQ